MSLLEDVLKRTESRSRRIEPGTATGEEAPRSIEPAAATLEGTQLPQPRSRDVVSGIDQLARLANGNPPDGTAPGAGGAHAMAGVAVGKSAVALGRDDGALVFRYFALGAASAIAIVSAAAYVWLQAQQSAGNIAPGLALQPAPDTARLSPDVPAALPSASLVAGAASSRPQPTQAAAAAASGPAAATKPTIAATQEESGRRDKPPSPQPSSAHSLSARLSTETPANATEAVPPVRVGAMPARVNPSVMTAYLAFQGGDLAAARSAYEQVLTSEPRNSDALHGLAAVALREGRTDSAQNYYLRALEADPKDNLAQAGLLDLKGAADSEHSESRLKSLLASQPDSPFLNFSLGNYYARHGRWAEAQQAYFRAWVGDSANPDYLFNLAVSLDQLRQANLALQYYEKALAATDARAGSFDREHVAARIDELRR